MSAFADADIPVYALSYDEVDALRDFRDAHSITYTFLSDPKSEVIEAFGILNTLIDPDDHPWYGIPYPGTYLLDAAGVITHKFFDNNLAVRVGPEQLLRALQGGSVDLESNNEAAIAGQPESVSFEVGLDGDALAATVQKDLVARFQVPAGRHVYAEPAPEGSVAVNLQLDDNPGLVQRPLIRPESHSHQLAGTGESFLVHDGVVELRIPLTVNNSINASNGEVNVSGQVSWQSCDDEVCDIPATERFELTLAVARGPGVALAGGAAAELEPNAASHFQHMMQRNKE